MTTAGLRSKQYQTQQNHPCKQTILTRQSDRWQSRCPWVVPAGTLAEEGNHPVEGSHLVEGSYLAVGSPVPGTAAAAAEGTLQKHNR